MHVAKLTHMLIRHTDGVGTSKSNTRRVQFVSKTANSCSLMEEAMHRLYSIGAGNCRKPWSSTGQGESTKPLQPTRLKKQKQSPWAVKLLESIWARFTWQSLTMESISIL